MRLFPHTVVGLAGGRGLDDAAMGSERASAVDEWLKHGATSWKERILKLLPPVLAQMSYERYAKVERSAKSAAET